MTNLKLWSWMNSSDHHILAINSFRKCQLILYSYIFFLLFKIHSVRLSTFGSVPGSNHSDGSFRISLHHRGPYGKFPKVKFLMVGNFACHKFHGFLKFRLSEKHTKFEKICFGWLLCECKKHEEDCINFCVLLRMSKL